MKQILFLSALVALICRTAGATLDLSPVAKEYASQGFTYVQLSFKHDDGRVAYNPPLKWTYKGSGTRLQLTPPNTPFAMAQIEAGPGGQPLTPELRESMVKQALNEVPPGSQTIELVSQGENTLLIDGRGSFEILLSYKVMGESFRRSIVYVLVGDMKLAFRVTARTADFDAIGTAFHASLGSWRWENSPKSVVSNTASGPQSKSAN